MRHRPTSPGSPFTRSPFHPIADYAFLSDCETTALVAPDGNIEWLCLPRMDSPTVFGALLDRDAGHFRLGPTGVKVPAGRRYLPGTMVLETSWGTRGGWVIVRDLLLMGPWHHTKDRSRTHKRTPTDYDADHVLLRTVRCVNGEVQLGLACEPAFDYGLERATWEYAEEGYNVAVARAAGSDVELRLTTDLNLGIEGPRVTARHMIKEGETLFCALSWTEHPAPRTYEDAYHRLVWTAHHWQHWLDRGEFPDHPWRADLQRSALTLKGLTYAPTGAIAAAATTSLPETPGGERNWDYRYSWMRDATFALWGLYTLGFEWEANDFFYFVADVANAEQGTLQIMYGIDGRAELPERTLDHLSGYENARPVRVGNAAHSQAQHDVWGAVLDSIYLHTKSRDALPESIWPLLIQQVETAWERWRKPDRGIWEVRGEPQHFTSSKLMCWVALDRGARLAELREDWERAAAWRAGADEIHADICEHALDDRGVFTQHYGTTALDASVLLMPLVRFLPADDPRIRATVLAVADELTEDGLVLRYKVEETDDGLSGEEGAFAICSFWLVSALCEIGEIERGRAMCEKLLGYSSPLGLYAEEIDPRSGRHLGNFPQAFTHLALINAVMHVIEAEEQIEASRSAFTRVPEHAARQEPPAPSRVD
jgi:GH15 family glucan-1,4-alpha-glucosidase